MDEGLVELTKFNIKRGFQLISYISFLALPLHSLKILLRTWLDYLVNICLYIYWKQVYLSVVLGSQEASPPSTTCMDWIFSTVFVRSVNGLVTFKI